jgi:hypothetical protein
MRPRSNCVDELTGGTPQILSIPRNGDRQSAKKGVQAARKKAGSRRSKPRTARSTRQTGTGRTGKIESESPATGGTGAGAAPPAGGEPPSGTPPPVPGGGGHNGYQRTPNILEAEDFARSLGVSLVRYTDPQVDDPAVVYEIANNTNEALNFIRSRGITDVPNRVETNRLFFIETNTRGLAWAVYVYNAGLLHTRSAWPYLEAIVINPRPEWVNVGQEVTRMHQLGYLSTGDPHHFIFHEFGHFLWRRDNPRRDEPSADNRTFVAARPRIEPHISRRALQSIPEFISEVFAQMLEGTVPLELQVEQLYRQLGGRTI